MKKSGPTDASLGHHVRARRKAIGMTQADLASAIGVSFQQVQKYEKGISAISRQRLQQICDIMHLPPEFFMNQGTDYIGKPAALDTGAGVEGPVESTEQFIATGEGKRLVLSYTSIRDVKLRTRILDFIASIAADQPK